MSQFAVKTQEKFDELHRRNEMLKGLTTLHEAKRTSIQESCSKLCKASEETNKRLNQVFEEQYHCKRHRDFLYQYIKKINVFQNMKPQPQGHDLDNKYQKDIKPDFLLDNKLISPSQYQDGDKMTYSWNKALEQLPEASSWPNFSDVGEFDHMELIDYIDGLFIDVPSIPDYQITSRLNTEFKGHASIWYTEMKEICGRRNWP
ncbi:hypothetical protein O181_051106 [Austropuccinia psidii MF-1]|uniref:Uncharacterized protein n=1 Tax=Austropuccinia psidii MF-1 TaxID=1389203 RepID=A0A9Q3HN05_9BASI|nr:hypothetical protein [Austropuccinia psidii MF-1]